MVIEKSTIETAAYAAAAERPLREQLAPVMFLVLIFLLNFISRVIFSQLLPTIEK